MKRFLATILALAMALSMVAVSALAETDDKLTIWSYGTPEYMRIYFQRYLDRLNTGRHKVAEDLAVVVEAGLLADITDYVTPYLDRFVEGAFDQATYNGRIYGMPYTLQPKMMFYNQDIFDQYEIDPQRMSTFEGYIEVGRELLEKSDGKVKLSYVDPGSYTWRYWFRRGLMPRQSAGYERILALYACSGI